MTRVYGFSGPRKAGDLVIRNHFRAFRVARQRCCVTLNAQVWRYSRFILHRFTSPPMLSPTWYAFNFRNGIPTFTPS